MRAQLQALKPCTGREHRWVLTSGSYAPMTVVDLCSIKNRQPPAIFRTTSLGVRSRAALTARSAAWLREASNSQDTRWSSTGWCNGVQTKCIALKLEDIFQGASCWKSCIACLQQRQQPGFPRLEVRAGTLSTKSISAALPIATSTEPPRGSGAHRQGERPARTHVCQKSDYPPWTVNGTKCRSGMLQHLHRYWLTTVRSHTSTHHLLRRRPPRRQYQPIHIGLGAREASSKLPPLGNLGLDANSPVPMTVSGFPCKTQEIQYAAIRHRHRVVLGLLDRDGHRGGYL